MRRLLLVSLVVTFSVLMCSCCSVSETDVSVHRLNGTSVNKPYRGWIGGVTGSYRVRRLNNTSIDVPATKK